MIICGYKFKQILEIVCLAGTHFSDFSKLAFYLFENAKKLIFTGTILAKIGQIANFAKKTKVSLRYIACTLATQQ